MFKGVVVLKIKKKPNQITLVIIQIQIPVLRCWDLYSGVKTSIPTRNRIRLVGDMGVCIFASENGNYQECIFVGI